MEQIIKEAWQKCEEAVYLPSKVEFLKNEKPFLIVHRPDEINEIEWFRYLRNINN